MGSLSEYVNIFLTLLAIVDPLGAIPFFLTLAPTQSAKLRRRLAWSSTLTVFITLGLAALTGEELLTALGISINSFRVAGGVLLLLIGISMLLQDKRFMGREPGKTSLKQSLEDFAVVPLGIPLLAGPGAISSMIIFTHRYEGFGHTSVLLVVSLAVALLTGLTLLLAHPIGKLLGRNGLNITIRLMGLILSAAAVQFMANGLLRLFPGLATP
ncbi:MAG: MarC family protein [candidate division FCPU426 bacterium]